MKTKIRKVVAGVHFERGVIEYLDNIAQDRFTNRSMVINQIVKEYALTKGITIPIYTEEKRRVSSYHSQEATSE